MELIQSSKDLLYVVIAFCVLLSTIFLVWFIYYLAMIMRQVYGVIKDTREKVNKVSEAITEFKKKMEHGAAYLHLINQGVDKISDMVKKKGKKKGKKN
ncbi:MAG: hypothetical protein ABIE43_04345 [Patescibacteria group bacterium]